MNESSSSSSSSSPSTFGCIPYSVPEEERISDLLRRHLAKEEISYRPGTKGGARYAYLDINRAVELANHIFDSTGWSSSVQDITVDFVQETREGRWNVGLSVIMRVTLRNGCYHEDIGYGQCVNIPDRAAALEKAKKEAASDGLKRALRLFGNKLGNCLADKNFLKRVEQGQAKDEPIDLSAPRKRMKLEDSFSASTLPPPAASAASASAQAAGPPQQQPSPPPPQQPYLPLNSSPMRTLPSSPPAAAPSSAARPQALFPSPPAPLASASTASSSSISSAPSPSAPYGRQPFAPSAQPSSHSTPLPKPRQFPDAATAAAGPAAVMDGSQPSLHYAAAPYSLPAYTGAAAAGALTASLASSASAPTAAPLPLPSISGIITSLPPSSSQHPSMPYSLPHAVKQEPQSSSSYSASFSMPPPPLPSHRNASLSYSAFPSPDLGFPALPAGLSQVGPSARSGLMSSASYAALSQSSAALLSARPAALSPTASSFAAAASASAQSLLSQPEDDAAFFEQLMPSKPVHQQSNARAAAINGGGGSSSGNANGSQGQLAVANG